MSYQTVPTVATGDSWTASQHNTYIRDNFAALWPYTAAGDIAYATGSNSLSKVAKPANVGVLSNNSSGVPAWINAVVGDAGKYLRVNEAGDGFEYNVGAQFVSKTFTPGLLTNPTEYTTVTNSTQEITLTKTSNILCIGSVYQTVSYAATTTNLRFSIGTTKSTYITQPSYYSNAFIMGFFSGITTGTKNVTLEYKTDGATLSKPSFDVCFYTVMIMP